MIRKIWKKMDRNLWQNIKYFNLIKSSLILISKIKTMQTFSKILKTHKKVGL